MNVCLRVGVQTFAHVWAIPTLWLLYFLAQLCLSDLFKDKRSRRQSHWPVTIQPVLLEEVKEKKKSQRGWKKINNAVWGVEDRKQYQESSGHAPKCFPPTYAGLISAFLAASVILLRHLQLRHIRKEKRVRFSIQRITGKLSAYTDGRGCTAIWEASDHWIHLVIIKDCFFFFSFWLNCPVGDSEWRRVNDLMHVVRMS